MQVLISTNHYTSWFNQLVPASSLVEGVLISEISRCSDWLEWTCILSARWHRLVTPGLIIWVLFWQWVWDLKELPGQEEGSCLKEGETGSGVLSVVFHGTKTVLFNSNQLTLITRVAGTSPLSPCIVTSIFLVNYWADFFDIVTFTLLWGRGDHLRWCLLCNVAMEAIAFFCSVCNPQFIKIPYTSIISLLQQNTQLQDWVFAHTFLDTFIILHTPTHASTH